MFESLQGPEIHIFLKTSRLPLGPTKPSTEREPRFFPWGMGGLKQTGPEVNHSHSSSTEVKNEWSYTSAGPVCFRRMVRNSVTLLNVNISVIHNDCLSYFHLYSMLFKI